MQTRPLQLVATLTIALIANTTVPAHAAGAPGNRPSYAPDISANGRYVVFASDATNLVAGDTNGKRDIFLRDTVARTTRLVTKATAGKANGNSFQPKVSDSGRYIAFLSDATNLVPGDTNNATDVFRADLTTGKIVRVSVAASGAQANKATAGIAMNATGSSIAFASDATNLVPGDTNARADIFLRDLATTAPKKLSNGWRPFPSPSGSPTISPDGRWVGFLGSPEAGDGPVEGVAWSRATGKSTRVCLGQSEAGTDTCDDLAASNAGVSYQMSGYHRFFTSDLHVEATPASLSFERWWTGQDNALPSGIFDVTTFGATALARDDSRARFEMALFDKTGLVASLGTDAKSAALAGGGSAVAYEINRQIYLWNRATGSATIVSVN